MHRNSDSISDIENRFNGHIEKKNPGSLINNVTPGSTTLQKLNINTKSPIITL